MAKYRKKPVVIEAVQWDGGKLSTIALIVAEKSSHVRVRDDRSLEISTLEGHMRANVGDWIIRGVQGELYPCKPDIFAATYEPVQ